MQASIKKSLPAELSSLVIPMMGIKLILPSEAVAEVLVETITAKTLGTSWYLGSITWRSQTIPVVSVEVMADTNKEPLPLENSRLAVIHTVCGHSKLPFYAIQIAGVPRLTRISPNDLKMTTTKSGINEIMRVKMGAESLCIPDLKFIESSVLQKTV